MPLTATPSDRVLIDRRNRRLTWVRRMRRGLPALAGLMIMLIGAQIAWREFRFIASRPPGVDEGLVQMINPAFNGQGSDGKRYRVAAAQGVRDENDPSIITLDAPTVTIEEANGETFQTVAKHGVFSQDDLTLTLRGEVRTEGGGSGRALADNTVIDTRTGRISGSGLAAQGGAGQVRADSYTITESGDRVILKGGVRARIDGQ